MSEPVQKLGTPIASKIARRGQGVIQGITLPRAQSILRSTLSRLFILSTTIQGSLCVVCGALFTAFGCKLVELYA